MKIKLKLAWFFPVIVIYKTLSKWAGKSFGPIVIIDPKYKDDRGLLEHELHHSKQAYVTLFLFALFYKFSARVRYLSEIAAYRVQVEFYSITKRSKKEALFASFIATKYDLNVSVEATLKDLHNKPKYWLWG